MSQNALSKAAASLSTELQDHRFFIMVGQAYMPPASSHLVVYVSCSLGAAMAWVPREWGGYPIVLRRSRPPQPAKNKKRIF